MCVCLKNVFKKECFKKGSGVSSGMIKMEKREQSGMKAKMGVNI